MPLLAQFIGAIATGLVALLSRFMSFSLALKFASYTAWIAVFAAFAASVFVCASSLNSGLQAMFNTGGTWDLSNALNAIVSGFGIGLSMFIPSNAATVMSCVASIWIACQVYKIQKQGMHNYSK